MNPKLHLFVELFASVVKFIIESLRKRVETMDGRDVSTDERGTYFYLDNDNDYDNKRLILKKNRSWTNGNGAAYNSLVCLETLKPTRSNPHILDAVSTLASSLAASQIIPNRFQLQPNPSQSTPDDFANKKDSPATLTAATTTHQTLATPTAIQLNAQPNSDLLFHSRAVLEHCKVNNQSTRTDFSLDFVSFLSFFIGVVQCK